MTAQEFVTAVQAGGTINVDSDVDFTDYEFTSYISVPSGTIINGNGYSLKNIYAIGINIFYGNNFTINYLNIINVNLPNSALFVHSSNVISTNVNFCKISGYIYTLVGRATSNLLYGVTFTRCSLNIGRWSNIFGYLVESYVTISGNLIKTSSFRIGTDAISCYITGSIDVDGDIQISTLFSDCVFNVDIIGNYNVSIAGVGTGSLVSIFNTSKNAGTYIFVTPAYCVGVTDSQMKDANYLFSIGFNIYTG